jgi:shikimate dehydrogenase
LLDSVSWREGCREAYVLGAGGAGLATLWNLAVCGVGQTERVVVVEPDEARRTAARRIISEMQLKCPVAVEHPNHGVADQIIDMSATGALIVNATGLGKDRPGSPVSAAFRFPPRSTVWDFNYRGDLDFLRQAKQQGAASNLTVEDGFDYFACGWSVVMSRVAGEQWTASIFESFASRAKVS